MIGQALDAGSRIAVMATGGRPIPSISAEILEMAAARGKKVELVPYVVEGAFDALAGGDAARHDALVAARARGARGHCSQQAAGAQFTGRGSRQDARDGRRLSSQARFYNKLLF